MSVHFNDYLSKKGNCDLHPRLSEMQTYFPKSLDKIGNIIISGPPGIGKYTQALSIIQKYSPANLKYERKLAIQNGKNTIFLKISDIHFEVDISNLGCNAKSLWHTMFQDIVDVVRARPSKRGIILCKYFHEIHTELIDNFYSYMQTDICSNVKLQFIILTEHVSFIPENIIGRSLLIQLERPTNEKYKNVLDTKKDLDVELDEITNIKALSIHTNHFQVSFNTVCEKIVDHILSGNNILITELRNALYDTLIYGFNTQKCLFQIIKILYDRKAITKENLSCLLNELPQYLEELNNNYRPIYHLERFCFRLLIQVYGNAKCVGNNGISKVINI